MNRFTTVLTLTLWSAFSCGGCASSASAKPPDDTLTSTVQEGLRTLGVLLSQTALTNLDQGAYFAEKSALQERRRNKGLEFTSSCECWPPHLLVPALTSQPVQQQLLLKQLQHATRYWEDFNHEAVRFFNSYSGIADDNLVLLKAGELDQRVRQKMGEATEYASAYPELAENAIFRTLGTAYMCVTDLVTSQILRQYLNRHDWPGISRDGAEVDVAAGLILVHAIHDVELQQQGLERMRALAKDRDTDMKNYARLEDRLLVMQGKPQLFGTQYNCVAGQWTLDPVDNVEKAEKRRRRLGLPPIQSIDGACGPP